MDIREELLTNIKHVTGQLAKTKDSYEKEAYVEMIHSLVDAVREYDQIQIKKQSSDKLTAFKMSGGKIKNIIPPV